MAGETLLVGRTFWELVERRADATPDALLALDEGGGSLSFEGFRRSSLDLAAVLSGRGVGPGTPVSWMLPTRRSTIVLIGALARLGAVQNPVVPIYRERETRFITTQTRARLLVVPPPFRGVDYQAMARSLAADRPEMDVVVLEDDRLEGDPGPLPPPPDDDAAVRWLFYTSGTTAEPKGARHTDRTLITANVAMARAQHLRPDDRYALVFPIAHLFGPGLVVCALASGCGHLLAEQFDPAKTIPFLAANGVTQAAAGPAFHQAYLEAQRARPDRPLFPAVRAFVSGGAPKSRALHDALVAEMGVGTVSGYGSTECPVISMASPDDPPETLAQTEGRVSPGMEVQVRGPDGAAVGPGEEGELWVRGPHLCVGYVDASLDAEAFDAAGFFATGDLGSLDALGYVRITGRLKEVIIRKGENVSALEVEQLLARHPKVAEVAVVGIPDPRLGERVCAVVRSADPDEPLGFDEMVAFLAGEHLARHKIPEQLEVVGALPRSPAGKVNKPEIVGRFGAAAGS